MTKLGPYEVHPFADAFPLIEGEEFDELVRDIKRNGLREPIVVTRDKTMLVDGRNRYRACLEAGVDVAEHVLPARYTEAMILDLIVSANLARRHLNPGQRAFLGLKYLEICESATSGKEVERKSTSLRVTDSDTKSQVTSPDRDYSQSTNVNKRKSAASAAKVVGASRTAVARAKAAGDGGGGVGGCGSRHGRERSAAAYRTVADPRGHGRGDPQSVPRSTAATRRGQRGVSDHGVACIQRAADAVHRSHDLPQSAHVAVAAVRQLRR